MPEQPKTRNEARPVARYDLEERLISFAVTICGLVESLPPSRLGRHVAGQLMRSATAAAPNYAEAQAAESRKDFVHKMRLCLKELRETLVWWKMVDRLGLTPDPTLADAIGEAGELTAIFARSISTATRRSRGPGL